MVYTCPMIYVSDYYNTGSNLEVLVHILFWIGKN